ncbi:PREDICTED: uncharacterized protein LOC108548427 [Eufriesea mexicana]|uniref:uncharacterized protein LOC108548427 n=1 Tax=Eufriesea mexicana TaxID=516756 RepID=UPI00083C21DD|nr:PREDICTED: uncharacterized protein LOC108548427 [Eufriesea mexicana]
MALLFLVSLAVIVQGYGKSNDPNNEPFLPIYPIYPYSPKLIKRGAEKESVTQLSSELDAPKADAKDSYSTSFNANHPRDPYYPNYHPYPKVSASSSYAFHGSHPYRYPVEPYNVYNPYPSPYAVPPPPSYTPIHYSTSYPNYYYQPPYYYPNYYSQPLFPSPPLPPPAVDYSDTYSDSETNGKSKKQSGDKRYRSNEGSQFVDGMNYISENQKDLDSQSSTYKATSLQNQLAQTSDLQIKKLFLPKTTYRVISVAGQPVGPDYPLPAAYVKAQQLEELMNRNWMKVLAQNLQQVSEYSASESNKHVATPTNDNQDQNDRSKDTRYVSVPNIIAKTGLTYVLNPQNILEKLNVGQTPSPIVQTPKTRLKNIRYPSLNPGVYTAIEKPQKDQTETNEYDNYETSSSQDNQDYDGSLNQSDKPQQNYGLDTDQSYQNQNYVTAQTPRNYNYQYNNYNTPQTVIQRQSQLYKNTVDNVNFGAKTKKG